jgi:hypothetical protein
LAILKKLQDRFGCDGGVAVTTGVSRAQLEKSGLRLAVYYSTPLKYDKYFNPSLPLNKQSLRLRPGSKLNLSLENIPTTARLNTVRRIKYQGDHNYIKADMTISTRNIPLYLDRETKCDCRYCGTKPTGDEEACRACGAPLPGEC